MSVREAEEQEDDTTKIEVSLGTLKSDEVGEGADSFLITGDELKSVLDGTAIKRKVSRQLSKAYTGQGDSKSKLTEIGYYSAYDAFDVVLPPYNLENLATIYELNSAHYAACNAKTANIVGLGYTLKPTQAVLDKVESASSDKARASLRKRVSRAQTELEKILDDLNAEDTFSEVLQKVWIDYEATGNGYIEVGRTKGGKVGYVGHAPAVSMRVRTKRDGFVQIVGKNSIFFRNFGDTTTKNPISTDSKPNEIIHIKKYTPRNTFYGVSDIVSAMKALAGDDFAQQFNLDYFEFKAAPRYVITLKGGSLSPIAEKRLHEFFLSKLKGKHHRSLYIPLPPDSAESRVEFKMEAVESAIQDASFDKYRTANRNDILMVHRVPLSKVGHAEGLSLGGSADADKGFKEQVTRPEQDRLEKRVNAIIREFTDMFTFELNELSLTDEDKQSQIAERRVRMQITVPNEERAFMRLPPREGGDEVVDLKPQQAEQKAQATQSRTRDQARSSGASDSAAQPRNPKGEGRKTP